MSIVSICLGLVPITSPVMQFSTALSVLLSKRVEDVADPFEIHPSPTCTILPYPAENSFPTFMFIIVKMTPLPNKERTQMTTTLVMDFSRTRRITAGSTPAAAAVYVGDAFSSDIRYNLAKQLCTRSMSTLGSIASRL